MFCCKAREVQGAAVVDHGVELGTEPIPREPLQVWQEEDSNGEHRVWGNLLRATTIYTLIVCFLYPAAIDNIIW